MRSSAAQIQTESMMDTPEEATPTRPLADRRVHTRTHLNRLVLVKLGGENGGIASDISEGGLCLAVALPLVNSELRAIRIQVPGPNDRIEAHGKIVWKSESRLRAGVQFADLSEQARQQIRSWIALEASSGLGSASSADSLTSAEEHGAEGQEDTQPVEDSVLREASNQVQASEDTLRATAPSYKRNRYTPEHAVESTHHGEGGKLAALVFLVAVLSFGIGWLTSSPAARNAILRMAKGKSPSTRSIDVSAASIAPKSSTAASGADTPARQLPPETDQVRPDPPLSSDERNGTGAPERLSQDRIHQQKPASPSTSSRESNNRSGLPGEAHTTNGSTTNMGFADHAEGNIPRQERDYAFPPAGPQAESEKPPQPNSAPVRAGEPTPPNHEEEASPQQPKQQAPADVPGSVVVVADPYPSIRLPLEPNSRKSPTGEHLQLGRLISRVDPVYPTDAKQHGIEGAVTLRALIGRDGSVQDVVSVNGPPLLITAAVNAVRQWRYSATLVAGQPVETEENISVNFQLSK